MTRLTRLAAPNRWSRLTITLFAILAVLNTIASAVDYQLGEILTKPLLMPLLAGYVAVAAPTTTPRSLVIGGLAFGAVGDICLLSKDAFIVGMGAFAAGHICYITAFVWTGAVARLRPRPWVLAGYMAFWAVLVAILWPRVGDLRVPIALYSLLLIAMAAGAAGAAREPATSWMAGYGAMLFVISDTIIGLNVADLTLVPHQSAFVMPTYALGQLLLTLYWVVGAGPVTTD